MTLSRFATAAAAVLIASTASASNLTHHTTVYGTDLAQAGLGGLRGVDSGVITLAGVSGTVRQAYLYWHGPAEPASPTANASIDFAGHAITGTSIGLSDDNFWGYDNSQAYRADVTAWVSGNGAYQLGNMRKPNVEINGASLIVFFDDGVAANDRDVALFDGNDANFSNDYDADGWNSLLLSGVRYSGGTASISFHVSDGQHFFAGDDGSLRLNGAVLANGNFFEGDSTAFSTGGVSNGKLWDVRSFDITSQLAPGANALGIQLDPEYDALSLVAVVVNLPAGAAPPIPEPGSYALLLSGLATLAALRRRR